MSAVPRVAHSLPDATKSATNRWRHGCGRIDPAIPYLQFTQHDVRPDAAFGGWLMPIVPPMVSAANGALLIPHLAAGSARATLLYGCYAMFGLSLIAALIIITLIWSRLALDHGASTTASTTTVGRASVAGV